MGTLAQSFYGIAAAAWLVGSGAVFAGRHLERKGVHWVWRVGTLGGLGALLAGLVVQGINAPSAGSLGQRLPVSSLGGRAALLALAAGFLSVVLHRRALVDPERVPMGWAELIPPAIVAGFGALAGSQELATAAPVLLICTLTAAGIALWSGGRALGVLLEKARNSPRAAALAFAALTATLLVVGIANWQVWGTPAGQTAAAAGLLAAWLIGATRLVLHHRSRRVLGILDLLTMVLMGVIALSVEWVWPFG